jgi:uncharacterized protein DUF1360
MTVTDETRDRAPATPAPTPPYAAYAGILGTFVAVLGAAGVLARSLGRDPPRDSTLDLAVLSLASFKAARTISRDGVTSFIRAPFVEGEAGTGETEQPLETGDLRQAIGELVTCSRCVGTWAAAGLATSQILTPRLGRLLTWSLAAAGTNDFLQAGFAALTSKTNALQERSGSAAG